MDERVIWTLKAQCVHRHRYTTLQHGRRVIGDWIASDNYQYTHQALAMGHPLTPSQKQPDLCRFRGIITAWPSRTNSFLGFKYSAKESEIDPNRGVFSAGPIETLTIFERSRRYSDPLPFQLSRTDRKPPLTGSIKGFPRQNTHLNWLNLLRFFHTKAPTPPNAPTRVWRRARQSSAVLRNTAFRDRLLAPPRRMVTNTSGR
jgi:hypothetical protein